MRHIIYNQGKNKYWYDIQYDVYIIWRFQGEDMLSLSLLGD